MRVAFAVLACFVILLVAQARATDAQAPKPILGSIADYVWGKSTGFMDLTEVARLLKLIHVDQTYTVRPASITDPSGQKRVFNVGRDHGKTRIILATRTTEIIFMYAGTEEGQLLSAVHITHAARRVVPNKQADPQFQLQKAYWVEQLGRESGCR
jgi:hypothetical protein